MKSMLLGGSVVLATLPGNAAWIMEPKHACGVCLEMQAGVGCERFGACGVINSSVVDDGCGAVCVAPMSLASSAGCREAYGLRVTKAFGTKDYKQVRVSMVTRSAADPEPGFFDYSNKFQYKWTQNHIHTALKAVTAGEPTSFTIDGKTVEVNLPRQGAGVSGLLIADPCVGTGILAIGCSYGQKFKTHKRIPELLNAFVPGSSGTDFWGIFGDNFYDRTGAISEDVFSRISVETKSKLLVTVAGNHDYWVLGNPIVSSVLDQCGNGHMQFYAQDAKAAEALNPGNASAPFDFSVDPDAGHLLGCNPAAKSNFFWYNQIGNVGLVGQSAAYSFDEALPFMQEACLWLSQQPGVEVGLLLGHWDTAGDGATDQMAMPQWYTEMAALPGCKELDERHSLKFVMGHTHCNDPHPHGKVGAGFRVAGFGMEGCGNFGVPLVDTTDGRVRFWYFDTSCDEKYDSVLNCVKAQGWRSCTDQATLWLDQPIQRSTLLITA